MQQVSSTSSMINNYRTEDPRSPLQKLDRRQLRAFCKHYGLAYTIAMPATTLREIVMGAGYDGTQPFTYPAPRDEVAEPVTTAVVPVASIDMSNLPPEVQKMSPPQLKKICKERGITKLATGEPIGRKAKKIELIQALLANPQVSETQPQMGFDNG